MRQQFDSSACGAGPQVFAPTYNKVVRWVAAAALVCAAPQAFAAPAVASAQSQTSAPAQDSAARPTDPSRTVKLSTIDRATIKWRDYGNGFIQLKTGNCWTNTQFYTCLYILRADGGRTTFGSWETGPGSETFHNGKFTIAKSRHPYVKIIMKTIPASTEIGYAHLY